MQTQVYPMSSGGCVCAQAGHSRLQDVAALCERHADERYLLCARGCRASRLPRSVSVVLRRDADGRDELQAFAHGWVLLWFMQQGLVSPLMVVACRMPVQRDVMSSWARHRLPM